MKHLAFILLLFLFSCTKKTKNEVTDSNLNSRINALIQLSSNEKLSDSIRVIINDKAFRALLKISNSKFKRVSLVKVVDLYYKLYENDKLHKSVFVLLNEAKVANDTLTIASSFNYIGKNKLDENQIDSAYYYFIKAEKIFIAKKDSTSLIDNYIRKAGIEFQIGDFYSSEISSVKSLNYNKIDNNKKYDAYNLIGASSAENHNYENAIIYHNKAIELVRNNIIVDPEVKLAKSYNNIGFVYQNLNNHKKAIPYFKLGLMQKNIFDKTPNLYLMLLDNYAYSKFKTNDFEELPNLFYEALAKREELKINQGIIASKLHLSEYYLHKKDSSKAKKFALESFQLAKSISGFDVLSQLKQLSNVDLKNAAKYSKEYIQQNDSIFIAQNKNKERFARIAFETDEIIKENKELGILNRNLLYYLLGTLVIFSLLIVIRTQNLQQKVITLKQQQQETNQEIYNLLTNQQAAIEQSRTADRNRMAKELHDGILSRMFGIRLNLDSINHDTSASASDLRSEHIEEIKDVEQQIREISHSLSGKNQKIIDNFVAIVIDLLEKQKATYKTIVNYTINQNIPWIKIANPTKINLYRILQESLQNCNKYADATEIIVVFDTDQNNIFLTIEDNGKGFNTKKRKKGIGLDNIKERAEESFGVFEIKSEPNKGTLSTITIPVAPTTNQQNNQNV